MFANGRNMTQAKIETEYEILLKLIYDIPEFIQEEINQLECQITKESVINATGDQFVESNMRLIDDRNFLIDMYIFQFEALAYEKDLQTLSVVNKLLNGDYLNNYASSFITAASESNVSPVYLASLSKQEVGGHSYATTAVSGNSFTYNGNTYSGIYNPYNIGLPQVLDEVRYSCIPAQNL